MTRETIEKSVHEGLKVTDGTLSGYAAVWNTPDEDDDVMRRGAFAKSIKERVAAGKILIRDIHRKRDKTIYRNVGVVREAIEDDHGLKMKADFFTTQEAQDCRTICVGAGPALGLSTGSDVLQAKRRHGSKGREFTELKLNEITISDSPAHEGTRGIKAASSTEPRPHSAARTAKQRERKRKIRQLMMEGL
jgi:hypothetical protein